jgi:hypothetical protein
MGITVQAFHLFQNYREIIDFFKNWNYPKQYLQGLRSSVNLVYILKE